MTKSPEANTIAIVCEISHRDLAPKFADAICPKLVDALSGLMPDQLVVERSAATRNIRCIIGVNVTLISEYLVKGAVSWANQENWESGVRSENEEIEFSLSDQKLNAALAGYFVGGLVGNIDPLADC